MNRRTRLVPALVAGALALGLTAGATTPASAAAGRPADWLESQLTDGLVHNDTYDFDDYGLTADTGMALAAIGGHRPAVRKITRAPSRAVRVISVQRSLSCWSVIQSWASSRT